MRDHAPWLKAIGALWMGAGTVALLWGTLSLLPAVVPGTAARGDGSLWGQFRVSPWAELAAIAGSAFSLITGLGLWQRRSWAQTLLVPAHLLAILYSLVGWIVAQVLIAQSTAPLSSALPWVVALAFGASIAVHAGLLAFMRSIGTTEALSWRSLQTVPVDAMHCEVCGSPLDLKTQLCPQCDLATLSANKPPQARLISLDDDTVALLSAVHTTQIGRGQSENDLNLLNPTVSRRHAQIAYRDGQYVLTALQDSNGTFVNETTIRERTLQDGDVVRLGRARFQFEIVPDQDREDTHA